MRTIPDSPARSNWTRLLTCRTCSYWRFHSHSLNTRTRHTLDEWEGQRENEMSENVEVRELTKTKNLNSNNKNTFVFSFSHTMRCLCTAELCVYALDVCAETDSLSEALKCMTMAFLLLLLLSSRLSLAACDRYVCSAHCRNGWLLFRAPVAHWSWSVVHWMCSYASSVCIFMLRIGPNSIFSFFSSSILSYRFV